MNSHMGDVIADADCGCGYRKLNGFPELGKGSVTDNGVNGYNGAVVIWY